MGRSLTAEKQLENALRSLLISSNATEVKANAAILVGYQTSETRDHLAAIVPVTEDNPNGVSGDAAITDYAEKVSETLPGGLSIIGVAIQVSTVQLKSSQPQFKQLLTNVWKRGKCVSNNYWAELNGCGHQVLVYFNKETKKFRFHWLQVSDIQSSLQPGSDVKFIPDPSPLLCIQSNINVPLRFIVQNDLSPHDILQTLSRKQCDSLLSSIVLMKDRVPKDSDPLEKLLSKGPGKASSLVTVQMLYKEYETEVDSGLCKKATRITNSIKVGVANGIHCRAYLPHTTTWRDSVKALKLDAIKSLTIRKNLLLDELAEMEVASITKQQVMLLPQRVLASSSNSKLKFTLSDYATLEDTQEDIRERVGSVWGGGNEYRLSYIEKPKEVEPVPPLVTEKKDTAHASTDVSNGSNIGYTVTAALVLVIGLLAALLIYYYSD